MSMGVVIYTGVVPIFLSVDGLERPVSLVREIRKDEVQYIRIMEVGEDGCELSHHSNYRLIKLVALRDKPTNQIRSREYRREGLT